MSNAESRRRTPLEQGTPPPDFRLPTTPEQKVSPADFAGQPVILAFYPADWIPVCSDQMALYQEVMPEFKTYAAQLLGISVDGVWCHLAFARHRNIPLLADFEPKGEVSRAYHPIARATASVNGRCSSSTRKDRCTGATCRRSGSIPAPTASCARS